MDEFFLHLSFSISTIAACMAVPFISVIARLKYWYRPAVVQRLEFVAAGIALVFGVFVVLKAAERMKDGAPRNLEFGLLILVHLLPLVLSLLLAYTPNRGAGVRNGDVRAAGEGSGTDYSPIPLNNRIENLTWNDLILPGTLKDELRTIMELLRDPESAGKYGIEAPKGILLNGPPGTGKTMIAKVIANTAGLSFFAVKLDEVVSKWVGDSEKNLSKLFLAAQAHAPSVIFIDEVDSIGTSRSGEYKWADNLLNHLLQLVDGVVKTRGIYIVAATNRADLVDPALKRAGRLNRVVEIGLPDFEARIRLFQLYLGRMALAEDIDVEMLAAATEGRSGADIKEICNQGGVNAFHREGKETRRQFRVTAADLEHAVEEHLNSRRADVVGA